MDFKHMVCQYLHMDVKGEFEHIRVYFSPKIIKDPPYFKTLSKNKTPGMNPISLSLAGLS